MTLRVLVVGVHPRTPGGVSWFVEAMKRRFGADIQAESFVTGRRPGELGVVRMVLRLAADTVRLAWCVLRTRYDVVHFNPSLNRKSVLRDGAMLAGLLLLRPFAHRPQVFIFFHGWEVPLERRICGNPLYCWIFRVLVGRTSRVAVLSRTFKDGLVAMGIDGARIDVVSTMFDGEELGRPSQRRRAARKGASILFLARFTPEKGVAELIEAFAQIADRFPEATLTLAGDGDERERFEHQVADLGLTDRVSFPGYVLGSSKADLLLSADIFVLPSYTEGLPIALLEAMAAGAAVITSSVGGIPEIVESPRNGILLDEISPDTVAGALSELLSDPDRAAKIGADNATFAWEHFESQTVTRRIESVYAEIAAEAGPA